jgi:signal transduction histidine kinase
MHEAVPRRLLWALGLLGAAAAVAASVETATSDLAYQRGLWIAGSSLITCGFLGVGIYAWSQRPGNRVGPLMVAVAYAWVVSDLVFSDDDLLFSIGSILSQLFIAVTVHLLLVFPSGRFSSRADRVVAAAAYFAAGPLYMTAFVFADPTSLGCGSCPQNSLLVADRASLAEFLANAASVVFALVALGSLISLVRRWRGASAVQRRALAAVLFAGVALLVLLFAATTIVPLTDAGATMAGAIQIAALVPFGLVPYVLLATMFRARIARGGALRELVAGLNETIEPAELRDAVARALGDPSVELAYWLPDSGGYVDVKGRPVEVPPPRADRAMTEVRVEGRLVAAIAHDSALLDDPGHVRGVGAAAALALEKQRLEAELRAKVQELRASRSRIIEEASAERRRLERDLHDGAQQRLVSLALNLRVAQGRVEEDPEAAGELLREAGGELEEALGELRELARGIHPAILSDQGLEAALGSLAARAPLPVSLEADLRADLPEPVELAAYFVVAEALTNVARYANASAATVRATYADGRIAVEVCDDGVGGADPSRGSGLAGLADRLATLEGSLELRSEPGAGTVLRAEIPCLSVASPGIRER